MLSCAQWTWLLSCNNLIMERIKLVLFAIISESCYNYYSCICQSSKLRLAVWSDVWRADFMPLCQEIVIAINVKLIRSLYNYYDCFLNGFILVLPLSMNLTAWTIYVSRHFSMSVRVTSHITVRPAICTSLIIDFVIRVSISEQTKTNCDLFVEWSSFAFVCKAVNVQPIIQ